MRTSTDSSRRSSRIFVLICDPSCVCLGQYRRDTFTRIFSPSQSLPMRPMTDASKELLSPGNSNWGSAFDAYDRGALLDCD